MEEQGDVATDPADHFGTCCMCGKKGLMFGFCDKDAYCKPCASQAWGIDEDEW